MSSKKAAKRNNKKGGKGEAKAKGAELRAKGWFDKGPLTCRQPHPQTKRVRRASTR